MWPIPLPEISKFLMQSGCHSKLHKFIDHSSTTIQQNSSSNLEMNISGVFTDSRKPLKNGLFVAIVGETFDGHNFVDNLCDSCFKENYFFLVEDKWFQAQKQTLLAKYGTQIESVFFTCQNTLNSFRGLASFVREKFKGTVICIGGSNGKTTTKEMTASLLGKNCFKTQKSENGYLGVALTLCSSQLTKDKKFLVLEIGIDEPNAMEKHLEIAKPNIVCLTALGPEHLNKLISWENCILEEFKMFESVFPTVRVWQLEDPEILKKFNLNFTKLNCGNDILVKRSKSNFTENILTEKNIVVYLNEQENDCHFTFNNSHCILQKNLLGEHNHNNLAASVGIAIACKLTSTEIEKNWAFFTPPSMRSEVNVFGSNTIINDCYNSSPSSLEASLNMLFSEDSFFQPQKNFKSFEKIVIVLGDMLDLGMESEKWHQLAANLLTSKIKNTLLMKKGVNQKRPSIHLCLFGNSMYTTFQEFNHSMIGSKPLNFGNKDTQNLENRSMLTKNRLSMQEDMGLEIEYLNPSQSPNGFDALQGLEKALVLVKGSRGMNLERVVKFLQNSSSSC
jgi:UDP-N-acetylmuramoyl-tripeptide--D-alanyl-D-alanine ligase